MTIILLYNGDNATACADNFNETDQRPSTDHMLSV